MNTETIPSGTIILGLGNPILGDDGIGCSVAEFIGNRLSSATADYLPELAEENTIESLPTAWCTTPIPHREETWRYE